MHPPRYVAARHNGSRYHLPGCQGLHLTRLNGNEVPITRAAAIAQRLLPCALCIPAHAQIPALAVV